MGSGGRTDLGPVRPGRIQLRSQRFAGPRRNEVQLNIGARNPRPQHLWRAAGSAPIGRERGRHSFSRTGRNRGASNAGSEAAFCVSPEQRSFRWALTARVRAGVTVLRQAESSHSRYLHQPPAQREWRLRGQSVAEMWTSQPSKECDRRRVIPGHRQTWRPNLVSPERRADSA